MRNLNCNVLSAADNVSSNGNQIDANQFVSASFHCYFGDSSAAGTFKLQASNDTNNDRYQASDFIAINWMDIPNQSAAVSSGAAALLTIGQSTYRWLRAVWTPTANFKQVQTVIAAPDVAGSLKSTYFNVSGLVSGVVIHYYVWFDNGSGVDPAVPGATGVKVTYSNDATAATLGGLIRAALGALTTAFVITGAGANVIITNVEAGVCTVASDGTAATGFTFQNTTPGVNPTTININLNALAM